MGVFTSPVALAGVVLVGVVVFHVLSANALQKRYNSVGAGPPAILPSNTLGLNYVIDMFRELRKHRFYHWTKRLLENNNHTLQLHMLGANLLLTDDPDNIKAIQDTQFWEVAKSKEQHEIFKHILGDAIFAMNGEEWKQEAGLLRPHMNRVRQSDFEVTERHIQNAFKLLEDGIDGFDVIDRLQLDVVTEVFCGESTNSLTSDQQPFRNAMDTLLKVASFRQLLGKVGVYLKDEWIAPKAVAFINDYLENFATKAYARNVRGKTSKDSLTLVDDLIVKGKRRADVKNAVTATLLAGKDPTTTSLAWAFYEIARHPYVLEKMQEEVKEHIGFERLPVMSDLHKLNYIKTVIKETLRVHHPLGFNARVPVQDMTLPRGGGPDGKSPIAVLKGTQILYGLLSLQQREDLGVDDVSVWNPERWETWEPTNKWEFVPFNHGPRICLGQQFANFQMEYFLARLCQEFQSITLLPESPRQEGLVKLELNTKMAHPVFAKSVRRVKD